MIDEFTIELDRPNLDEAVQKATERAIRLAEEFSPIAWSLTQTGFQAHGTNCGERKIDYLYDFSVTLQGVA